MTPTRELCMQIGKDIKKFSKYLNLRAVCVYGGTGISEQIAELKRGAEIIVCTPGRMIDMLAANNGKLIRIFVSIINRRHFLHIFSRYLIERILKSWIKICVNSIYNFKLSTCFRSSDEFTQNHVYCPGRG
jgi:DEAD/DEAH box helicase